ncbi:CLUMA_CG008719, isoform A [Clunio marinus]|uniref:CLUMA_CG008719, isoform A n=1 Tax=Clunio marinus TaxID=568069 RepID=A0A1J1I6T1_9DIPT|nr:CLUMA_CG008719, isoform A [Clunio marinus]
MYSSIEAPSSISSDLNHKQFRYHSNAFNVHPTANTTKTTAGAAGTLAPISKGSTKSVIRPSTDAHIKQQTSSNFNNNSYRNKFSYGAYDSTCSNNNIENVKHNIRTTMFNEKIIPRGPYLQYKMSENDNKSNYMQPNYYHKTPSNGSGNGNVEALKEEFDGRGILPRAKITSNSVLEKSGVDYNLRTQTIGRYRPVQPTATTTANIQLKKAILYENAVHLNNENPHNSLRQQNAFSCHTLPVTRRENQQKEMMSVRSGNSLNYITLESALNVKIFHQLTPTQGWAMLCQSVQALQDLFLSETPSINRVLPVITPRNFLLTTRGRVVYGLLTIDNYNEYMSEYLSEEFKKTMAGKILNYNEADVEKMWIYSLGKTLMKTMPTILPQEGSELSVQQQHHSSIVLQATIWKMCKSVEERASLMFLLNFKRA